MTCGVPVLILFIQLVKKIQIETKREKMLCQNIADSV